MRGVSTGPWSPCPESVSQPSDQVGPGPDRRLVGELVDSPQRAQGHVQRHRPQIGVLFGRRAAAGEEERRRKRCGRSHALIVPCPTTISPDIRQAT